MEHVLINHTFISREEAVVDIEDRGYQFGDGIYEVIRVYNGHSYLMQEHMERLARSAHEIEIALPYPIEEITDQLEKLIPFNHLKDGIVYVQLSRGAAPRAHGFPGSHVRPQLVAYTREVARPIEQFKTGVKAILTEDLRWLRCDIKSLNLLGNVLAKQKAQQQKAFEAIQHRGEVVTEGSATNVFIVQEGVLYTHPATNLILNGITKNKVLQLCDQLKLLYREESFTTEQLLQADEVFITSTTSEVTPVIQIQDQEIGPGIPGPITVKLQQAYEDDIKLQSH